MAKVSSTDNLGKEKLQIIVDFSTLKFNLYEILGITPDCNESKIKKAFRNLILNFHPDKNSETEEDIYHHIITANQVLCDTENRKLYDDFLSYKEFDHSELKNDFKKKQLILNASLDSEFEKNKALNEFNLKFKKLEVKHNINNFESFNILDNYEKEKNERDKVLPIIKESINSNNEFNDKFNNRIINGDFQNQLIELNEGSLINVNDNYTSLDVAFDNLYLDNENLSTNKYTSIDKAFKIQAINSNNFKEVDVHESMENYKTNTNLYKSDNNTFTKDMYNSW
jgi:DnaJ-class molecular chaperone